MKGDDGAVPAGKFADEVFQHVGELVGHAVLHRGGEVQDDLLFRRGVEVLQHRLADFHGVVHFRAHEGLGGILKAEVHAPGDHGLGHLIDEVGGVGGDFGDLVAVHVEDHLALEGGGGIVEMKNHILRAPDSLKGLPDEVFPGLDQHLDGHVARNVAALDELPADFVFRLAGGREANFNLLHADVHQRVEILQLLRQVHGVNQRLVSVPQVHRAPNRGFGNLPVRPSAALNGLGLEGNVLFKSGSHSGVLLAK